MESLEADFARHGSEYTFSGPQIPLISGVTGRLSTAAIATPEYWSSMVHQPVRFAAGIRTMHQQGVTVFVEIGPKPILLQMGIPCLPEGVGVWLPSLRPGQSNWQQLLFSLAQLYSLGAPINWSGFDRDYPRHRLRLPTYPFERQRYWLDTDRPSPQRSTPSPPPRRSLISTLLDQGDSEQIAQLLAQNEPFSPEQVQLLPKLLASLVRHHQATALSIYEHESSLTSQTASQGFPFPGVVTSEPMVASERSPIVASPKERQQPLENYLAEQVARVLLLSPSQLDRQQPLNTLGLDSLMAIQLTNRLRTDLALELPLKALLENMSIIELSWQLQTQLTENSLMSPVSFSGESNGSSEIATSKPTDHLPLSFAQERLWWPEQLNPSSSLFNLPFTVHLTGELDIPALERSLNELVRRQAALRTTFDIVEDRPIQIVHPTLNLSLPIVDLRSLCEPEQQTEVQRLSQQEAQESFDLVWGPLVQTTLLRLREDQYILLVTLHHLISDGSSMVIFGQDLGAIYQAFSQGQPSPLPELPIQYADFVVWQRQWLQGEVLATLQSYWQQRLGAHLVVPELRTDRPRPAVPTFRGAVQSFQISETLSAQLKALSQQAGCTLFMLLLAALQILLHHHTGQLNFSIGTAIANRNRADLEALIGCFINFIVIPTDLTDNPTFRQVLHLVRKSTLEAYAHRDLPFKHLLEIVSPSKVNYVYKSPLSVVLIFHSEVPLLTENVKVSDRLSVWVQPRENGGAIRDLTLHMVEGAKEIWGSLNYDLDLFVESTIKQVVEDFLTLLQGIALNPDLHISEISEGLP
jgi:aryl carrier-like protein